MSEQPLFDAPSLRCWQLEPIGRLFTVLFCWSCHAWEVAWAGLVHIAQDALDERCPCEEPA